MAYTETVEVLRGHLEDVLDALEAAHTYHAAADLQRRAESLSTQTRQSRLTALLEQQMVRVAGYLPQEEEADVQQG